MNFFDWTLLNIRLIQLKREFKILGIFHKIIIPGVLAFAFYKVFSMSQDFFIALATFASTAAVLLLIQVSRKDKAFVFMHLAEPRKAIFTEYAVPSFIFSSYLLFSPHFYFLALIILSCAVISGVKYEVRKKTKLGFLGKLISPKNFEWIGGIRKSRYSIGIIYIAALAVSGIIFLPLFCLWILTIQIFSFYKECEPANMLRSGSIKPPRFMKNKIFRHSVLLAAVYSPVLIINSAVNPALIFFNLVFLIVQVSVLALTITFKYKIYSPGDMLPVNDIYLILIQVCTVLPFITGGIPFLLPLPLFLCIRYYFSAKDNLKFYLYD